MKIFTIQSQFLGEFTAKFKYSYSQEYSPQCESSISKGPSVFDKSKIRSLISSLSETVSLATSHSSITAGDRASSSSTLCNLQDADSHGVIARSKLHAHMHNPGGTAQLTHSGSSKGSVPLNSNWRRWRTLYFSDCFPPATRCNDQMYLFDIANSHGRIGEQVRSNTVNWLKF